MKYRRLFLRAAAFLSAACATVTAATINVSSLSSLQSAINGANAGDVIILANGSYSGSSAITVSRAGTSSAHITIKAASIGGATIGGSAAFHFASPAAFVDVQGFVFTHSGSISIPSGTNHIRLTRNVIQLSIPSGSDVSYINISGDDVQIDYNELRNKSTLGEMLDISGSGSQVARRLWVHHNYFHDFTSPGGNGAETIRWGLSGLSLSDGNGICEYNLFVRCNGENEMISNKSSSNTYRYNTVIDSQEISQRHGNFCQYYGNYMRNSAAMRIYGDDHLIHSNYFEGNDIGVNMGNGDGEVENGAALTSHDKPDRCVVVFNTMVNCTTGYEMGGRTGGLGADHITFANNIIQGGTTAVSISSTAPYSNATWSGNIIWNPGSIGNIPSSGYSNVNPLLAADAQGVFHLQSGSPAIGTATGTYSNVTVDMDGQPRPSTGKDKGADEVSTATVTAHLLTTADVGPNADLGGGTVAAPTFTPGGGTYTSAQSVSISTTTSGASIRYTTDGSTPTSTTGTLYSGPVSISSTTTLKAIAFKSGMTDSTVTTATYTINTASGTTVSPSDGFVNIPFSASQAGNFTATVDAIPSISPSNTTIGLCQGAQTSYTNLACIVRFSTTGNIDARNGGAYAADNTIPFSAGVSYHFRFVVNVPAHTYSIFVTPAGGSEIAVGSNYAFRTEVNTVTSLDTWNVDVAATPGGSVNVDHLTVTATSQVAAPTFSPGSGTYSSAQSVTISTTTSGASIRYTTNGTTPTSTTGTLYSGPVSISSTTTLKAIAFESGFTDSAVSTANYTINTGQTITSADGFVNIPFSASQSGSFTATIDAVPSLSPSNTTIALCQGAQTSYTNLACIVRFNTSGNIDARNGGAYAAASTIPFSAGVSYHFRFAVNVSTHTYSIFVTPAGGSEITVGSNYAFRTEVNTVTSLDNWNVDVNATPGGSVAISNRSP